MQNPTKQWRTEGAGELRGSTPPPEIPKFWAKSNRIANWAGNTLISLEIAEFRTPAPQDVRKEGSKILKLPRFVIVLH
jgi:hypothetical protein